MKHTLRTPWRWQRAHTLAIVVIEAVFQAPMSPLNTVASLNACEPSHTLAASAPTRSVQCTVHAASSGPSVCGATLLALDHRDAAQLRQLGLAQAGKRRLAVHVRQSMRASILAEKVKHGGKHACMPAGSLGRGRQVWAQQRAIPSQAIEVARRCSSNTACGPAWQPSTGPSAGKRTRRGPTAPY